MYAHRLLRGLKGEFGLKSATQGWFLDGAMRLTTKSFRRRRSWRQQQGKAVQFPRQRDCAKFNKRLDAGLSLQLGAELIGHFYVNVAHTMAFASSPTATTTCWMSEAPECSAGAHTLKARPDSVRDALAYRVRRTVRSCGVMSCRKLGCFGSQSRRRLRVCQSL